MVQAVSAQEGGESSSLTLQELIGAARTNNPELRVFAAGVEAARGGVTTASVFQNPDLSFTPALKHLPAADGNPSDTMFKGTFGLNQVIEFPGKRTLRRAIAEKDVAASQLALDSFGYQVELQTRKVFGDLLAAQEVEALRSEQVESAKVFAEAARKRAESGYAADFEVVKAETELVNAKKSLREAQANRESARVGLNSLAGRSADAPLKISGTLDEKTSILPTANLITFALTNHPGLRVQNVLAERAGLNIKSVRLSRKPDFTVGPSVEYARDEQIYGFGISVPLPFWNNKKGEIQTANAGQKKALAEAETLQREVVRSVSVAAERLRSANDQLALYSPDFRSRLKAVVEQAEKSYAQSATSLLIYLDAKRTYFDTLADYTESLAKVAEARAELESAVGVPFNLNLSNP